MNFSFKQQISSGTEELLHRLAACSLFRNAGRFDGQAAVLRMGSWNEAIESIETLEWENFRLEHANHLTESLFQRKKPEFQRWNRTVRVTKPKMMAAIRSQLETFQNATELPKVFRNTVEWDILSALLEEQYMQFVSKYFYSDMLEWYFRGHFPCGYLGIYPNGKFTVY